MALQTCKERYENEPDGCDAMLHEFYMEENEFHDKKLYIFIIFSMKLFAVFTMCMHAC